jgi:hypothetical protein
MKLYLIGALFLAISASLPIMSDEWPLIERITACGCGGGGIPQVPQELPPDQPPMENQE